MKSSSWKQTLKLTVRVLALIATTAVVMASAESTSGGAVLGLNAGHMIGFERMIEELKGARLIFVGETHENMAHHLAQLEIIKAFRKAGKPFAIGLEMFTAENQGALDQWVSGKLDPESFIKLYYNNWHMAWPLYKDIFLYAREHRIPLIGLNVARSITHKVAQNGFAALSAKELGQLPAGITCVVDARYREFIERVYLQGHAGKDTSFTHFCEAQMVWNKSMGKNLHKFLIRHPDQPVIILTGSGHAMKLGIAAEVFQNAASSVKVVLPEVSEYNRSTARKEDADYLLLFDDVIAN